MAHDRKAEIRLRWTRRRGVKKPSRISRQPFSVACCHFVRRAGSTTAWSRCKSAAFSDHVDANQFKPPWDSAWNSIANQTAETVMTKLSLVIIALFASSLLTRDSANAADGCGAGLYRDHDGRCHFYRAAAPESHACQVGFIWRNGRCRQNIGNDPFVSTWPNAPR